MAKITLSGTRQVKFSASDIISRQSKVVDVHVPVHIDIRPQHSHPSTTHSTSSVEPKIYLSEVVFFTTSFTAHQQVSEASDDRAGRDVCFSPLSTHKSRSATRLSYRHHHSLQGKSSNSRSFHGLSFLALGTATTNALRTRDCYTLLLLHSSLLQPKATSCNKSRASLEHARAFASSTRP